MTLSSELNEHLIRLAGWSLLMVLAPLLWVRSRQDQRRGFALGSIGWSAINLLIVAGSALNRSEPVLAPLREFLALNLGLNAGYIGVGITLAALSGNAPFRKGIGQAVVIHGLALLILDGWLLFRLPPV